MKYHWFPILWNGHKQTNINISSLVRASGPSASEWRQKGHEGHADAFITRHFYFLSYLYIYTTRESDAHASFGQCIHLLLFSMWKISIQTVTGFYILIYWAFPVIHILSLHYCSSFHNHTISKVPLQLQQWVQRHIKLHHVRGKLIWAFFHFIMSISVWLSGLYCEGDKCGAVLIRHFSPQWEEPFYYLL